MWLRFQVFFYTISRALPAAVTSVMIAAPPPVIAHLKVKKWLSQNEQNGTRYDLFCFCSLVEIEQVIDSLLPLEMCFFYIFM